ncbi:FkbM family methyltransferase [Pedobacter sp. UYP30]|uniref:FkbM family methyltransferase n=1 Tax=Pedobacter sp. UYP30 TaxID=1756400 RepID=UPI003391E8C8
MVKILHRIPILRTFAKVIAKNIILSQKFYSGRLFFNAVDHSWAWTGNLSFQKFDSYLQESIIGMSYQNDRYIDVGCNVGGIGLAVLLNNKTINSVFIDPNKNANACLIKSLKYNKLENRCTLINAVAACTNDIMNFNSKGSVLGHVSDNGKERIKSVDFWALLAGFNKKEKILVKIDIEGFESKIFKKNFDECYLDNVTFIIELHPQDFNGLGNPLLCFDSLINIGFEAYDLNEKKIVSIDPEIINQVVFRKSQLG